MASTAIKRARRAQGLCTDCGKPAAFNRSLCETHLQGNIVATSKKKHRYVAEGRCWSCGRPRLTGKGMGGYAYKCPRCEAEADLRQHLAGVF